MHFEGGRFCSVVIVTGVILVNCSKEELSDSTCFRNVSFIFFLSRFEPESMMWHKNSQPRMIS
jgi:hypothetical protein